LGAKSVGGGELAGIQTCALATDDGDEAGGHRYSLSGPEVDASTILASG
jgi:hypothetical protein